jgi:hypothetical protein
MLLDGNEKGGEKCNREITQIGFNRYFSWSFDLLKKQLTIYSEAHQEWWMEKYLFLDIQETIESEPKKKGTMPSNKTSIKK